MDEADADRPRHLPTPPPPEEVRADGPYALRMARGVTTAVLLFFVVNSSIFVWTAGVRGLGLAAYLLCLAAVFLLQLAHSTGDPTAWPAWARVLSLTAQAVASFTPYLWVGEQSSSMGGFLAGSMLLVVTGYQRWALYAAVGAAVSLALWLQGAGTLSLLYAALFTLLVGLIVYGVSSLATLVQELHAARGELARMAVMRERLRVARDLHDLLGHDLSAMAVKSELAYRLLPGAVERARQEMADVREVARRSLADVQVVAGGDSSMSLVAELTSAESILVAAEMRVGIRSSVGNLTEPVETVLAFVVREAVTNVLRHSKAQTCEIEVEQRQGLVRLRVANDGVEPSQIAVIPNPGAKPSGNPAGSGLAGLRARLAAIGGTLRVTVQEGRFELTAEVPPTAKARERQPEDPVLPGPTFTQSWHMRLARLLTIVVVTGYALIILVNALAFQEPALRLVGFAASLAALLAVQLALSLGEPRLWPAWWRAGALSVELALTVLPVAWISQLWGSMGGFLAGSVLLVLATRWRWVLYAAVGLAVFLVSRAMGDTPDWTGYLTISTLLTGLVVYGISTLSGLVRQVNQARDELTRMAVTRERLRVTRDLHDLLGHDLWAISVKSELAVRLLTRFAGRAKAEIADMLDIARRAIVGIRQVASGYRHMSLAAEVDSAVSTLTAADLEVSADIPLETVPEPVDMVFALVLREAVMNVLRHSTGTACRISVVVDSREARLTVTDDGLPPGSDQLRTGTGLGDLAARMAAIGGCLTASAEDGAYRLVATVPAFITSSDIRDD